MIYHCERDFFFYFFFFSKFPSFLVLLHFSFSLIRICCTWVVQTKVVKFLFACKNGRKRFLIRVSLSLSLILEFSNVRTPSFQCGRIRGSFKVHRNPRNRFLNGPEILHLSASVSRKTSFGVLDLLCTLMLQCKEEVFWPYESQITAFVRVLSEVRFAPDVQRMSIA